MGQEADGHNVQKSLMTRLTVVTIVAELESPSFKKPWAHRTFGVKVKLTFRVQAENSVVLI